MKEECHTTVCKECFSAENVCDTCTCDTLRRCDRCVRKDLQCSRIACLNLATDCQLMFTAVLERLDVEQKNGTIDKQLALSAPNLDIVRAGKNIHRSHSNWFLFVDKARFSTAVLQTARFDSSQSKELSAVITDMVLTGRDWMETTYVAESKTVVHTLVPEMFWKEYGANKKDCLEHPISLCLGSFGSLYLVDFTAGSIVKARLYNPVDVQVLSRSMESPTSVLSKKGVVLVVEEKAILYLDVGNVVRLNLKVLWKPQLESELQQRGLIGPGERKPVAEMRSTLIRWLKANVPQTTRDNGFQSLLDGIRPLALTLMKREV